MTRRAHSGLTIVEVVVALALLAINLLGWAASVRLIVALLQRTASLLASVEALAADEAPDLAQWCTLGLLIAGLPRLRGPRCSSLAAGTAQRGLTLVELLIALALSGLLFTLVAGGFASSARFARTALAQGDALSVRLALPTMLQQVVEVAGRGIGEACSVAVDASGQRLTITYALGGGTLAVEQVFAALDGGGRPALYLRRLPHPRQPWLEGVTSFTVVELILDGDDRVAALGLEVVHTALAEALEIRVSLPHRPCLGAPP